MSIVTLQSSNTESIGQSVLGSMPIYMNFNSSDNSMKFDILSRRKFMYGAYSCFCQSLRWFLYPGISHSIAQQQTTTENADRIRISISLTVVYLYRTCTRR